MRVLLAILIALLLIMSVVSCVDDEGNGGSSSSSIATVIHIGVNLVSPWGSGHNYSIYAELRPTSSTQPNRKYIVALYEKGQFRAQSTVSWNQPELNVLKEKDVYFGISKSEHAAYMSEDISHIFSVKVLE